MENQSRILVLGGAGMVGKAIYGELMAWGYTRAIPVTRQRCNLENKAGVDKYFDLAQPEYVFMAAAKVGGIKGNTDYPADFIYQNLTLQSNVIDACYKYGVKRLIFLGSSCIYPKNAPQPMKEEYLMGGYLEETNKPYAIAKIAGIEMCRAYNKQYGTDFISVMPTNLYGDGDNYHPDNSHVIPGLIDRLHKTKEKKYHSFSYWGTGKQYREFLHADDLANALVRLMQHPDKNLPDLINIGSNTEISIKDLTFKIAQIVGFNGTIHSNDDKTMNGPLRKFLNCDRFRSILSLWSPKIDLNEGIKRSYADYLKGHRE